MYTCPMHSRVRRAWPGKCPSCDMTLIDENARFGVVRHVLSSPLHVAVMLGVMLALMAAAMMLQ